MSDLYEVREKTEAGAEWRGTITVAVDGEPHELTVRQLRDPEFWDVMSDIDTDELDDLGDGLPDDELEEFADLQDKDDLDEEEEARFMELQEKAEQNVDIFDALSYDTYQGLVKAAKYGVEPDQEDIRRALTEHTEDINEMYGGTGEEEAEQYLNDHVIEPMIDRSTDFTSFSIGIEVLGATLDEVGN